MLVEHTEAGKVEPMGEERPGYFSVVVPTYNRAHLLGRALRSIQAQTFRDFEVIIVDDGSTDDPASVVEELADSRFRIIRQANAGAAAARNHGAWLAKGEYITFLDSDDEALPEWLAMFADSFDRDRASVVCLGVKRLDGERGKDSYSSPKPLGTLYRGLKGKFLAGSYALRRGLFQNLGGFDDSLPAGHHTDFSLRLCKQLEYDEGQIACVDSAGVLIYDHAGEKIRRNHQAVATALRELLRKHAATFEQSPSVRGMYLANAAVNTYRAGERGESVQLLWQACRSYPRAIKNWVRLGLAISRAGSLVWVRDRQ